MNLKFIIRYLRNNFIIQLLGIAFSGVVVTLLNLYEIGIFNLAKSLAGSFQYTHLGLRYSLDRLLPENDPKSNLLNMRITIFVNSVFSFFLLGLYLYIYLNIYDFYFICYLIGGWLFASFSLIRIYYRGIGQIDFFIKITFLSNLLVIVIPLIGVYIAGSKGLFISYLLINCFLINKYFSKNILLLKWDSKYNSNLFYLFKTGIPIFVTNIVVFLGDNIDKFIINYFLGIKTVGEFGIITLAYSLILILPSSIVELVFPEYIKQKSSKNLIRRLFLKHIMIGLILIITAIIFAYFILPIFLDIFLHKYFYLLAKIKIILLALVPYIFISPLYCLLFAHDKSKQISIVNVISLVIYFIATFILLYKNYNLEFVLYAKILYTSIYCIGLVFTVWHSGLIKEFLYDKEEKTTTTT